MQDPQSLHKYAYVHGDPVQGIDPTGMFFGSLGSFFVSTAIQVGVQGLVVTSVTGAIASATYGFYFQDNPVKGFFYGAELGLALSTAYSFGGGGASGARLLGETIAKATAAGFASVAIQYLSNLSNPNPPTAVQYQQTFFESFANSAWTQQFGWFLREEYRDLGEFGEAGATFAFSFGASFAAGLPTIVDGWDQKLWRTVLNETGTLTFNSLEKATVSLILSPAFDRALKDIPEPGRTVVKGILGGSYVTLIKSLREILAVPE